MCHGNTRKERGKGTEDALETVMMEHFPRSTSDQTSDPGSSEVQRTEAGSTQTKTKNKNKVKPLRHSILKVQKIKDKHAESSQRGKSTLPVEE